MPKPYHAIILAGGVGVRLDRPDSPKPLVTVGGKPLIVWNIEQLQQAGVTTIHIVLGHRGEEIKKELTNNPLVTASIVYHVSEEQNPKISGVLFSLKNVIQELKQPFFLTMADLVIEHNPYHYFLSALAEENTNAYALISLDQNHFEQSGALSKVEANKHEIKSVGRDLTSWNGLEIGVYYFGNDVVNLFLSPGEKDTFDTLLNKLAQQKKLKPIELKEGEWYDVNTPSVHVRAELFARQKLQVFNAQVRKDLKESNVDFKFLRDKRMSSDIIISTGIVSMLSRQKIIPDSSASSTHFLLTDTTVAPLYGDIVLQGLRDAGYDVRKLIVPTGEASKSIEEYTRLAGEIFAQGVDKRSIIISLGGGVVNNIAGFLASTLYRGIGLIHIPTTTMAQVDAAIDFKQAINSRSGKNLLGSYYPAMSIIIDPGVIASLDSRNIANGFSESIKHALTQDVSFLEYLKTQSGHIRDLDFVDTVTRKTIELKVPLLNGDVQNDYNEMIPQYGHAVGHAVEHLSSYNLLHGEAIAIGMCVTAEIAVLLGISDRETLEVHYDIFKRYNLPTIIPEYMSSEDVVNMLRYDKHFIKNPYMALVEKPGKVFHNKGVYGMPIDYSVLKRAVENNKKRT